jgi:hypothetical protein
MTNTQLLKWSNMTSSDAPLLNLIVSQSVAYMRANTSQKCDNYVIKVWQLRHKSVTITSLKCDHYDQTQKKTERKTWIITLIIYSILSHNNQTRNKYAWKLLASVEVVGKIEIHDPILHIFIKQIIKCSRAKICFQYYWWQ